MNSLTKADKYVDRSKCRLSCDFEILRRSPVFSGLNLEVVKLIAYLSTHRTYQVDDYLIEQGQKAQQAFVMVKGAAEITVHHRDREIIVQKLDQDSFFGELALLAKFEWFFNVRALSELDVIIINQTTFQKVIEKFPEHKDKLIERIVKLRVDRLAQQTFSIMDRIIDTDDGTTTTIV